MQYSYIVFFLLGIMAASGQSLANEIVIRAANLETNTVNDGRHLRGSVTSEAANGEERDHLSAIFSSLKKAFRSKIKVSKKPQEFQDAVKKTPSFAKLLKVSEEFQNAVRKNPSLAKILDEDEALVKTLTEHVELVKFFKNPATSKYVAKAVKDPDMLKLYKKTNNAEVFISH